MDPQLHPFSLTTILITEDRARAERHRLARRARPPGRTRRQLARGLLALARRLEPDARALQPQPR